MAGLIRIPPQSACALMWGPSLIERLLAKWSIVSPPLVVSVFLFLLGHTHNLLRSVLHAVFAQQIHGLTWRGNQLDMQANRRWVACSTINPWVPSLVHCYISFQHQTFLGPTQRRRK